MISQYLFSMSQYFRKPLSQWLRQAMVKVALAETPIGRTIKMLDFYLSSVKHLQAGLVALLDDFK